MSVQRFRTYCDMPEPDENGQYVTYSDHLAEVEWCVNDYARNTEAVIAERVEAMRAACIAAVEALDTFTYLDGDEADYISYRDKSVMAAVLAALREVQP